MPGGAATQIAQAVALPVLFLAAVWLVFVAATCALAPERARSALAALGSTRAIQLGEHIPRAIVGIAMVLRAPLSKYPAPFEFAGWFILASSIAILLAPMRWHNAYAVWWAERIPLAVYRYLCLPTLAMAALLTYVAW